MKKLIKFLFTLFLLSNICFSQSGWFIQNPLPTTSTIEAIDFINSNTGYMVGDCNAITKTTDGGITWVQQNPKNFCRFATVQFFDVSTGIASGYNSILRTTNGGDNWNEISSGLSNLYFIDYNTGYANLNSTLIKTTNGGINWITISTLSLSYILYFVNEMTGFGGYSDIIKTTNGGVNWISYTGTGLGITDFFFLNINTGYTVGANGNILKTTNSGLNWQLKSTGTFGFLEGVSFVNENTGFVAGPQIVLKTTDGGDDWTVYDIGTYLNAIEFLDLNTGYASGSGGGTYKTTNSGNTWVMVNSGIMNTLRSVYFPSNNLRGYCAGDQGIILNTINGGNNWTIQNSGTTLNLNSLFFLDDFTGYVVCNEGKILKTINGGSNWIIQNTGFTNNLYGIYFFDMNTGFVSGVGGNLFKTTNGGINWNSISTGIGNMLNSIHFVNPNTGFIAGLNHVLRTTNGGNSWNIQYVNSGNWANFKTMFFLSELIGYVAGEKPDNISGRGIVLKTTDCGNNWTSQFGFYGGISSIKFTSFNVGYMISGYQRMHTTNGGTNWVASDCASGTNTFNSIYFIGEDTGYIVGYNGVILKTIDGGGLPIGIERKFDKIPLSFSLSQNYPNPFNPVTKIEYEIPPSRGARGMMTQLIIYDILGREIETLVNESQKPGSYEITWDGSHYASGVYFYRLYIDDASAPLSITKKMVLIK